jgi:hypothetical protein
MDQRATEITIAILDAGIPIHGVAVDGSEYRIDFKPEATPEQRQQAADIADAMI